MSERDMNLERLLDDAADYNAPPAPPREEMWSEIRRRVWAEAADGEAIDLDARREAKNRRWSPRRWTPWALGFAAAAMLAVGFGLGRVSRPALPGPQSGAAGTTIAKRSDSSGPSLPVRLATAEHMDEAEALLTVYRTAHDEEDRAATAKWARDLLGTTRLLLDSRVGKDPKMADLLSDLELVLVQIADADGSGSEEQKLIADGIDDTQLLAKLRSASSLKNEMAL